jgi:hypothetical protein
MSIQHKNVLNCHGRCEGNDDLCQVLHVQRRRNESFITSVVDMKEVGENLTNTIISHSYHLNYFREALIQVGDFKWIVAQLI